MTTMSEVQEKTIDPSVDKSSRKKKGSSDKSPSAWKFETAMIYVGPTMPKLTRYVTYQQGFPHHIQKLLERVPELETLFVPVPEFPKVRSQIDKVGTPLHAAYQAVLSAAQKGSV